MFRPISRTKLLRFLANYKKLLYVYLLLMTIILGLLFNKIVFKVEGPIIAAFAGSSVKESKEDNRLRKIFDWLLFDADNCEKLLEQGLPVLNYYNKKSGNEGKSERKAYESIFTFITNIDFKNPHTYFHNQIPLMARLDSPVLSRYQERELVYTPGEEVVPDPNQTGLPVQEGEQGQNKPPSSTFDGTIIVGIYHSHNSETFSEVPGPRGDYHLDGQNADIVTIGEELTNYLQQQYKIGTVHSKAIHDYPIARQAYQKSVVTAEQILKTYPTIKFLLDIHRDSQARAITTTEIGGKEVARILIVVGTNRLGLAHPNWEKNYALAKKMVTQMEESYPGLSRGILVADARYNQHLSPGSLIIEVGSCENKKEEALNSIRLFGDVLASMLAEM